MSSRIQSALLAIATLFAGLTGTAVAQDYRYGWDPRSGDVWVDDQLQRRQPLRHRATANRSSTRSCVTTARRATW